MQATTHIKDVSLDQTRPNILLVTYVGGEISEIDISEPNLEDMSSMDVLSFMKKLDDVQAQLSWDSHREIKDELYDLIMNLQERLCRGQWGFSKKFHAVDSVRYLENNGRSDFMAIHEIVMLETRTDTLVITARSAYAGRGSNNSRFVKDWDGHILVNNGALGLDRKVKPVRVMWKNQKTKKVFFALPVFVAATKKLFPEATSFVSAMLNKRFNLKDVLPISEYYTNTTVSRFDVDNATLHPQATSMADIHFIGSRMSIKEILKEAFRHPHGVTKNAFGGLNGIQATGDLNVLRAAVFICRILRGYSPDVLERVTVDQLKLVSEASARSNVGSNIAQIQDFFKKFGCKGRYADELIKSIKEQNRAWFPGVEFVPDTSFTTLLANIADSSRMFRQIKGRNHRAAIRAEVARNNLGIVAIHDLIANEVAKLGTVNKKIKETEISKVFAPFNGKEIIPGVTLIMPKMSHDLVEWGSTQANCIGSHHWGVDSGQYAIFGLKLEDGTWLGHGQVTKAKKLEQLLGKYNHPLPDEERAAVLKFLKKLGVNTSSFWGDGRAL